MDIIKAAFRKRSGNARIEVIALATTLVFVISLSTYYIINNKLSFVRGRR